MILQDWIAYTDKCTLIQQSTFIQIQSYQIHLSLKQYIVGGIVNQVNGTKLV